MSKAKRPDWWSPYCQKLLDSIPAGRWFQSKDVAVGYGDLDAFAHGGVIERRWVETDVMTHVKDHATGDVKLVPIMRQEFKRAKP